MGAALSFVPSAIMVISSMAQVSAQYATHSAPVARSPTSSVKAVTSVLFSSTPPAILLLPSVVLLTTLPTVLTANALLASSPA